MKFFASILQRPCRRMSAVSKPFLYISCLGRILYFGRKGVRIGIGIGISHPGAFRAYLKHICSFVHMGYGSSAFTMPPRGHAQGKQGGFLLFTGTGLRLRFHRRFRIRWYKCM